MNKVLPAVAFLCLFMSATAHAAAPVVGKGDAMRFDNSDFPAQMKANYEILKAKCTKCHTMERIAIPFVTGITPITGQPFDMDAMKSITFTMVRKANAKGHAINKEEARSISRLLIYLLDESVK